jgi:selenide,water dikinase
MHSPALPATRDIVLIGGGHTHALVLKRWGMQPLPGARLTVINPGPTAPYTGMLPGHIAGHYTREALEIDLVRLARHAGARLILGKAVALDRAAQRIHVPGRAPIGYDIASLDIGITGL